MGQIIEVRILARVLKYFNVSSIESENKMTAVKNSNPKTKERNARSWLRSVERHARNTAANVKLHEAKAGNDGLGARELRRIEAGVRKTPDAKELEYIKSRPSRGKRRRVAQAELAVLNEASTKQEKKKK